MLSWRNLEKCFFFKPCKFKVHKVYLKQKMPIQILQVLFLCQRIRFWNLFGKLLCHFANIYLVTLIFEVRKQSATVDTVLWTVLSITKMTTQRSGLLLSHSGSFRSVISGNLFCCFLLQILAFLAILSNLLSTSLVYGNDPFLYKVLLVFSQLGSSTNKYYRKQGDKEFYHQSLLRFYGVIFPCS